MSNHTNASQLSRRRFVKIGSLTSAALTIGFYFPGLARDGAAEFLTGEEAEAEGINLTAWISIDKNGKVILFNHRSEMGQGSYQSVPQILAEELEVDLNEIRVEFAKGYQGRFGSQITGGSSTIRGAYKQMLKSGAAAREMLIEAAAQQWKVAQTECAAQQGKVIHLPTKKELAYGALVAAAIKLPVPKDPPLKARKDYKLIGKSLPRLDNRAKINGTAIFGMDKVVPDMVYAMVERNPRFHGKIKSFDATAALAIPGIEKVFPVEMPVFGYTRHGVAVVGNSTWACMQARKVLKIEWDDSGIERVSTKSLFDQMKADLEKEGNQVKTKGDFAAALSETGTTKLEAVYQTPYEAHSCMEPVCCVAHWKEDKIQVWGPIQGPDWVQGDLAKRYNLKPEAVDVYMTFLGGGFGRKAFLDYTTEAVEISKKAGKPVKVVWSREDDMTQGPFRPGALYKLSGVLKAGKLIGLKANMAGQNMDLQNAKQFNAKAANSGMMEGITENYLDQIPNFHFADVPTESPVPVMWWRSVYSSTNTFAYESFMDEMAIAAGMDPMAFRKAHLNSPRAIKMLEKLADMSGWQQRKKGEGYGMAMAECFASHTAQVVKLTRDENGTPRIAKVFAVIDCGWYVSPDIIKQQVEGSIQMGYGAAVVHETHFEDGMAVEKNFNDYDMPRLGNIPEIEIHIMENDEVAGGAGGAGEPALPPFAPALANAVYDLTGKRMRSLPFSLED